MRWTSRGTFCTLRVLRGFVAFSVVGALTCCMAARVAAQPPVLAEPEEPPFGAEDDEAEATFGATARVAAEEEDEGADAASRVTRAELDERMPRSTPDALRFEPGVAVQQTAHAQASVYVRGLTGQQVVHVFDGVRLNNGIYRQGPNQYFFTIDQRTVAAFDVFRGSASVRHGADALGGALVAHPISPVLEEGLRGVRVRPRLLLQYGSADRELGGRAQLEVRIGEDTALLLGAGYRDVDRLRSGGVVRHLDPPGEETTRGDVAPWVPRFAEEPAHPSDPSRWRTQLGTGFREATYDARLVRRLRPGLRLTLATYGYRQLDAPRTDQCPPPEAPLDECLEIDQQNRSLTYVALHGDAGPLRDLRLTASYQAQDERRTRDRPRSRVRFRERDHVDTLGVAFHARTPDAWLGRARLRGRYGFDAYRDQIARSRAERTFTDIDRTDALSRGRYLEGAHHLLLGAWGELELQPATWVTFRSGARVAGVDLAAPPDPNSGSPAIDRTFGAVVGRGSVTFRPHEALRVHVNVDQGFRAPNLDDLTARQQVGPGFQFDNPDLRPERSLTTELGLRVLHDVVRFDAWAFATTIEDGIQRAVRGAGTCPPEAPGCSTSRTTFQLVNASERSVLLGAEGGVSLFLPHDLRLRATASYAWGEGPNLGDGGRDRVPLSRVPPPQGTFEGRWRHRGTGVMFGAALRWAAPQSRLAVADASDPRIPFGGTPGYATVDLRAGWRFEDWLSLSLVVENLGDAAYRVHGSSIQGPGRSAMLWLRVGQ